MGRLTPYLLYLLICVVAGVVMATGGYGFDAWRYWVILACVIVAHITGQEC